MSVRYRLVPLDRRESDKVRAQERCASRVRGVNLGNYTTENPDRHKRLCSKRLSAGERFPNELWEDKNIWSHVARTWVLEYQTRAEEAE